jgi:hypothetical protein
MHGGHYRYRRVAQFSQQHRVLEIRVAVTLAQPAPIAGDRHRAHDHQVDFRQRVERQILAPFAAALERGGVIVVLFWDLLGINFAEGAFCRGVGVITVMFRSSASFRTQRCGESGSAT